MQESLIFLAANTTSLFIQRTCPSADNYLNSILVLTPTGLRFGPKNVLTLPDAIKKILLQLTPILMQLIRRIPQCMKSCIVAASNIQLNSFQELDEIGLPTLKPLEKYQGNVMLESGRAANKLIPEQFDEMEKRGIPASNASVPDAGATKNELVQDWGDAGAGHHKYAVPPRRDSKDAGADLPERQKNTR